MHAPYTYRRMRGRNNMFENCTRTYIYHVVTAVTPFRFYSKSAKFLSRPKFFFIRTTKAKITENELLYERLNALLPAIFNTIFAFFFFFLDSHLVTWNYKRQDDFKQHTTRSQCTNRKFCFTVFKKHRLTIHVRLLTEFRPTTLDRSPLFTVLVGRIPSRFF